MTMSDPSSLEELRNFVRQLKKMADAVSQNEAVSDDERTLLSSQAAQLSASTDALIELISSNSTAWGTQDALRMLGAALGAAYVIGERTEGLIKRRVLQEANSAKAAHMRASKPDRGQVDAKIREFAEPIWNKQPKWTANKIAGEVRESVNRHLKINLTADAIRKRLKPMMP
jgi:hypothetical protein